MVLSCVGLMWFVQFVGRLWFSTAWIQFVGRLWFCPAWGSCGLYSLWAGYDSVLRGVDVVCTVCGQAMVQYCVGLMWFVQFVGRLWFSTAWG
ncbi:hypothetical protein RRG08_021655 [Elysia crispata]|uniref:Uncharacterized protein n=1 Tax=Elysia crispata TaxID=231223 RepID=A0AAE0XDN3_9GAST|nr:hypothetical protein RRG08_021655 [Elysia crispata]